MSAAKSTRRYKTRALRLRQFFGAVFFGVFSTGQVVVWASDAIYVAYGDDGTSHFSSQPYDKSYRVYQRDSSLIPHPQAKASTDLRLKQSALAPVIHEKALQHGVDLALVSAIIAVESGFNPRAVSSKGAVGAMQLIPSTAKQYGVSNPYDVQQNLDGGMRYLKDLLVTYNGNLPLVLAAYNAGQGNVSKHHQRIPPFAETMLYVPKVLAKMEEYQRQNSILP